MPCGYELLNVCITCWICNSVNYIQVNWPNNQYFNEYFDITAMVRIGVYQYECLLITYSCVHIRKKCHKQKNEHKRALTSMPFNLKYNKSDRIRQRTWYQIGFYLDQYIYILYIKHTCNKKEKRKKWDHPFEITLNSPHIVVVSAWFEAMRKCLW